MLTVLSYFRQTHPRIPTQTQKWAHCKCFCGNFVAVRADSLVKKNPTASCGCLNRLQISALGKSRQRSDDPVLWAKFTNYQREAPKRGHSFELAYEEFKQFVTKTCYYCGHNEVGIDRLDNTIGYVVSNCVPCCKTCNYAKRDMSVQDFLEWVNRVWHTQQL